MYRVRRIAVEVYQDVVSADLLDGRDVGGWRRDGFFDSEGLTCLSTLLVVPLGPIRVVARAF